MPGYLFSKTCHPQIHSAAKAKATATVVQEERSMSILANRLTNSAEQLQNRHVRPRCAPPPGVGCAAKRVARKPFFHRGRVASSFRGVPNIRGAGNAVRVGSAWFQADLVVEVVVCVALEQRGLPDGRWLRPDAEMRSPPQGGWLERSACVAASA